MTNTKGLPIDFLVGRAVPLHLASPRPTTIAVSTTIRILIADDQTISRCGLRKLLETQSDFDVVGEATDPAEAVRWTHELKPDVLLVALSTHDWSGLDVLSELTGSTVRTILLIHDFDTADTVKALHVGARGVILKDSPMHLLFKSIRCVFRGEIWLGRDAMLDVVEALSVLSHQRAEAPSSCLTAREKDVLTLVVSGYTNKDTARKLSISEDTVKHHLTSIFDKTGVSNRLELALFAIHHHFVGNP